MSKEVEGINQIFNILAKDIPNENKVEVIDLIVKEVIADRDETDYSKQKELNFS